MTQNEIMALINAKIAGQGSAIDIGGALPVILSALTRAAAKIEVDDITALTDTQLDTLEIGAGVAKKTGTAQHMYVVSYKDAENGGLCLTYIDASVVETVSYDHTENGWVYNSTDVTPLFSGGSEAMIVHGSFDENDLFVPDAGEPTFEEALSAYYAGRVVRLGYTDSDFGPCLVEVKAAYNGDNKSILAGDDSTMSFAWVPASKA